MKIAKLNIEGYIGELDKESAFAGEKNFTLANLKTFLSSLDSGITDIHVDINSGGGSVFEGWDIHDELQKSGKNIITIGRGIVGSIATVIFLSANPENRKLIKGTKFFIHHPYWLPNESEPIRADELLSLGNDLKDEQNRILNLYARESKSNANELYPLMSKETDLTSEMAVRMGFASEEIEDTNDVSYHQYRLVAMINSKEKQLTQNTMTQTTKEMSAFKKFGLMLNRIMKGNFKAMDMPVIDEAGNNVTLFIETETEDLVGKNAYLIAEDGSQSPAPDGKYTDGDGKMINVTGGVVASVDEPMAATEPVEADALKAELEALKATNLELTNQLEASKTEGQTIKAQFEKINTEFVALKTTLIGAGAEFKNATQTFDKGGERKGSEAGSAYAERLRNKNK